MNPIFRQTYTLTDSQADAFGRAKPSALLSMVQEIAGAHCLSLGTDWETLQKKHLFWAVTRHHIQITRLPRLGQTITLETWPMPTTRVAYPRAVAAFDEAGKPLFQVISLWVLMDVSTRSMVLPEKSGITVDGLLRGNELSSPRALPAFQTEMQTLRQVQFCDLDRNQHMNNARYLDWAMDLLPSSFHRNHPVKDITLCYLSEASEGQQIDLQWTHSPEDLFRLNGYRRTEDLSAPQERVFGAQLQFDTVFCKPI